MQIRNITNGGDDEAPSRELKPGSISKLAGGAEKLGTFSGVFVPTTECFERLDVFKIRIHTRSIWCCWHDG